MPIRVKPSVSFHYVENLLYTNPLYFFAWHIVHHGRQQAPAAISKAEGYVPRLSKQHEVQL